MNLSRRLLAFNDSKLRRNVFTISVALMALLLFGNLAGMVQPIALGRFADSLVDYRPGHGNPDWHWLGLMVAGGLGSALVNLGIGIAQTYLGTRIAFRFQEAQVQNVIDVFDSQSTESASVIETTIVEGSNAIKDSIMTMTRAIAEIGSLIMIFLAMARASLPLAILSGAPLLLNLFVATRFRKGTRAMSAQRFNTMTSLSSWYQQLFRSLECIQLTGSQEWAKHETRTRVSDAARTTNVMRAIVTLRSSAQALIGRTSFTVFCYGVGGVMIAKGIATVGDLLTIQGLTSVANSSLQSVLSAANSASANREPLRRALSLLGRDVTKDYGLELERGTPVELMVRNVAYELPSHELLVADVSFHLAPGQIGCIMGASGSGKTTLAKMLTGFLVPSSGEIFFNSHKYSEISRKNRLARVQLVPHSSSLFQTSVLRNITLCRVEEVDRRLFSCICDIVELSGLVDPNCDYEGPIVNEGAQNLSQGQRQRIGLARALYRCPSVLIIDEATSNLPESQERDIIRRALDRFKYMSVLMITHRVATADIADFVIRVGESNDIASLQRIRSGDL